MKDKKNSPFPAHIWEQRWWTTWWLFWDWPPPCRSQYFCLGHWSRSVNHTNKDIFSFLLYILWRNQIFSYQIKIFYQKLQGTFLLFVFLDKIFSDSGLVEGGGVKKNSHLKSGPLSGKLLVVKHGLQHLPVAPGNQANGS